MNSLSLSSKAFGRRVSLVLDMEYLMLDFYLSTSVNFFDTLKQLRCLNRGYRKRASLSELLAWPQQVRLQFPRDIKLLEKLIERRFKLSGVKHLVFDCAHHPFSDADLQRLSDAFPNIQSSSIYSSVHSKNSSSKGTILSRETPNPFLSVSTLSIGPYELSNGGFDLLSRINRLEHASFGVTRSQLTRLLSCLIASPASASIRTLSIILCDSDQFLSKPWGDDWSLMGSELGAALRLLSAPFLLHFPALEHYVVDHFYLLQFALNDPHSWNSTHSTLIACGHPLLPQNVVDNYGMNIYDLLNFLSFTGRAQKSKKVQDEHFPESRLFYRAPLASYIALSEIYHIDPIFNVLNMTYKLLQCEDVDPVSSFLWHGTRKVNAFSTALLLGDTNLLSLLFYSTAARKVLAFEQAAAALKQSSQSVFDLLCVTEQVGSSMLKIHPVEEIDSPLRFFPDGQSKPKVSPLAWLLEQHIMYPWNTCDDMGYSVLHYLVQKDALVEKYGLGPRFSLSKLTADGKSAVDIALQRPLAAQSTFLIEWSIRGGSISRSEVLLYAQVVADHLQEAQRKSNGRLNSLSAEQMEIFRKLLSLIHQHILIVDEVSVDEVSSLIHSRLIVEVAELIPSVNIPYLCAIDEHDLDGFVCFFNHVISFGERFSEAARALRILQRYVIAVNAMKAPKHCQTELHAFLSSHILHMIGEHDEELLGIVANVYESLINLSDHSALAGIPHLIIEAATRRLPLTISVLNILQSFPDSHLTAENPAACQDCPESPAKRQKLDDVAPTDEEEEQWILFQMQEFWNSDLNPAAY